MKGLKIILIVFVILFLLCINLIDAADIPLKWDASSDATGYIIYQSVDNGTTWGAGIDVGNLTGYTVTNVPDTGLILWRISAYNAFGESIQYSSGAWYCGDWKPPEEATGLGVE